MHRKLFLLSGLSLVLWGAGCCMCDAPYDYCGPTFLGGPCTECVTDARMNSVFNPYPGPFVGEVVPGGPPDQSVLQESGEPNAAPADAQPDVEAPPPMPAVPATPRTLPPNTTQVPHSPADSIQR